MARNRAQAEFAARESKARELAALSTESLSEDPERSILLGMQAVNATLRFGQPPVPAAEDALHQAILSSQVRMTLRGHSGDVNGVAFSPDGNRLATASNDQTAKVWDAESGKELPTLRGHSNRVDGAAFSPDGKRLATASVDATVQVYAFDVRDLLNLGRNRVTSTFTVEECQRYFQSGGCPPEKSQGSLILGRSFSVVAIENAREPTTQSLLLSIPVMVPMSCLHFYFVFVWWSKRLGGHSDVAVM